jgi:hypothetical protein
MHVGGQRELLMKSIVMYNNTYKNKMLRQDENLRNTKNLEVWIPLFWHLGEILRIRRR